VRVALDPLFLSTYGKILLPAGYSPSVAAVDGCGAGGAGSAGCDGLVDAAQSQRPLSTPPPLSVADMEADDMAQLAPSQQQNVMVAVTGTQLACGATAMSLYDAFVVDTEPFEAPAPSTPAPPPTIFPPCPSAAEEKEFSERQYKLLTDHLVERQAAKSKIGRTSNLLMCAQAHWGATAPRTLRMVAAHYSALDEGKSGEADAFPEDIEKELLALGCSTPHGSPAPSANRQPSRRTG
jgi:hypothetical protein